jgi:predicted dehydrogenase
MAELRVGIAGYGTVGKIRHRAVEEHPQMHVVAVCDQSFIEPETRTDGINCWTTYDQLLANERELDVLFVCLPNYVAPEATIAGLEQGLHVGLPGDLHADPRRARLGPALHDVR